MRRTLGFTLVELMVTVAVAVILITLGAPAYQELVNNNRRTAQVNEFVADLTFARGEALKRNTNVGLCRASDYNTPTPTCGSGTGWESGWIVFNDVDGNNNFNNADTVLRRHPALVGNQVSLRGNIANIVYWGTGRVSVAGTFNYCDHRGAGSDARAIVIALPGRVNVTDQGTACP